MNYNLFFQDYLERIKQEGRYRTFINLERSPHDLPYALWRETPECDPKKVIVWCTNDYLGMSQHPHVIKAMSDTIMHHGAGSGGTRNISGTLNPHVQLERTVARMHGKESGLIFISGYSANEGTLYSLTSHMPDCVIFSDAENHASIIQGIRLSRCDKQIFKHNDVDDLWRRLKATDKKRPKIIACLSVYPMSGGFSPLEKICNLAEEFNALSYVDEVHAVGLYGPYGAGLTSELELADRFDIIQGNFAKGFGVIGGYITGSHALVDFVRSTAPNFIFTTSLPPSIAVGARISIETVQEDASIRQKFWDNVNYFKQQVQHSRLPNLDNPSHIVPLMVCNAHLCKEVSDRLLQEFDIYVQPINYPTVPKGAERLRLTVTPHHTREHIDELVYALNQIWVSLKLPYVA